MTDSIGASPQAVQRAEVMAALKMAARSTGVGFDYLVKTAQRESNFDPNAKAGTSSATGLFQFTDGALEDFGKGERVGVANGGGNLFEAVVGFAQQAHGCLHTDGA